MNDRKRVEGRSCLPILAVIISGVVSCIITFVVMSFSGRDGKEPLPQKIIQKEISPDGKTEALLFEDDTGESMNFLGSHSRNYLGLKRNNITYIISRDLTEGSGSYEGGVLGIRWIDDHQILIERVIGDQQKDIIFDINQENWLDYNKGLSNQAN